LRKSTGRLLSNVLGLAIASVAFMAVPLGAAPSGAAPTSAPTVTLTMARHAFDSTFPGFAAGFAHKNLSEVRRYATAEVVQAVVGYYSCGCATWTLHISTTRFSVPTQQQYPLTFLAEATGRDNTNQQMVQEVVLDKDSPDTGWRIAYMVDYEDWKDMLGASVIADPPPIPFDIGTVGEQFANFFQTVVNTGAPPPDDNWPLTGTMEQQVDHYVGVKVTIEGEGDSEQVTFSPSDQSVSFKYPSGAIMCGTMDSTAIISTPAGLPTVQPRNQSIWGPLLPPGSYSSLTKYSVEDFCFNAQTNGLTEPISFFGGVDRIVGTPYGGAQTVAAQVRG